MLRERLSCGERAQHRGSKLDSANDAPAAAQQLQGQKHSEGSRQAVLQSHTSESATLNSSSSPLPHSCSKPRIMCHLAGAAPAAAWLQASAGTLSAQQHRPTSASW